MYVRMNYERIHINSIAHACVCLNACVHVSESVRASVRACVCLGACSVIQRNCRGMNRVDGLCVCSGRPDRVVRHGPDLAVVGPRRVSQGAAVLAAKQGEHDVRRDRDAVLLASVHDQCSCRCDGAVRVDVRPLGVHPRRHPLDDHACVDTPGEDAVLQVSLSGVLL